jgi:peptidyl-prolyl cis-trans isomerase C
MKNRINKNWSLIFTLIAFVVMTGYGNTEETKKDAQKAAVGAKQVQSATTAASVPKAAVAKQTDTDDIAVSVEGKILKKSEIEKAIKEKLNVPKGQDKPSADQIKEIRANIKKQMVDGFMLRTLMANEAERRKIKATDKEIKTAIDEIKASLPPGRTVEAFMKENKISREHIILGIKVKKMVAQDLSGKEKPTEAEIRKFYDEHQEQVTKPENVHVRHILILFAEGDDDKAKAEKKARIEFLRDKLLHGADFAETARANSDCPSKENGGDLGTMTRGQTVKAFEDAAFSQEINAIGPVVTTEFGYHIIQVLEHNLAKAYTLEEVKDKISDFMEQKRREEAFAALANKLREKAKIIIYEN